MENQKQLINALVGKQVEEGKNDTEFAKALNLKRTTWLHVKEMQRVAGLEVLHRVLKTYPDMAGEVLDYLRGYPGRKRHADGAS